jgi:hypothetical protein
VGDWGFSFSGRHDTVDYKQKRDGEANSCPGVRLRGQSCREGLHLLATISISPPSWHRFDALDLKNGPREIETDYDALTVETRGLKGPRTYDASGIPFHKDGLTIIKERFHLDKNDPNLLHDDITTIDNALTRPWSVVKTYRRVATKQPIWWREDVCAENNAHVIVGDQDYFLSADGLLMPARKGQLPPGAAARGAHSGSRPSIAIFSCGAIPADMTGFAVFFIGV